MNAYDSARLDDYWQRTQVRGETLSPKEQETFERLMAAAELEADTKKEHRMYVGDYPDVF